MNSGAKIIVFSACVLFGAMMMLQPEVNGQETAVVDNYCNSTELDVLTWDSCYRLGPGYHKSVSICYWHTRTLRFVYRYDYCKCLQYGAGYILTPFNCSKTITPADANHTMVCNRYNDGTKRCSDTCPTFDSMTG